jgi:AcrR family transcriptional regulator
MNFRCHALCYAKHMNRKRLTREDSKDQTKQRLMDAAQKLVAKKGLDATSVEDIAAAAGYTRGAFYSNFDGKHELFIDLLRREHDKVAEQFNALLRDEVPIEEIKVRTLALYSTYCSTSDNFMSWTEARMLGSRDAKFRAKLNALLAEKRDQIAQFIEYFYQRAGTPPPVAPPLMALGFMSLIEGVKLFELSSPSDMTTQAAQSILALFMDSVINAPPPSV